MEQNFRALEGRIVAALNDKFRQRDAFPGESRGYTLVDSFVMQPLQDQASGLFIGGKSLPMVAVVGNSTGRIYYFALKAILPDLTI